MTAEEAYKILGISPGAEKNEIKKRYRQLMLQVHPDVAAASRENYAYSAQEINIAYSVLIREKLSEAESASGKKGHRPARKKRNVSWDAPVNANAYREREVLQYAEDHEGTILGNFCVARGKYLWKTEEDFPLFLLSLYRCGKQLLDEIDSELCRAEDLVMRQRVQGELTYLLAQQFIDGSALLKELAKEENAGKDGSRIFYLASMLEVSNKAVNLKAGEPLYPSRVARHRLYVKDQNGRELGYLSFRDDRLYYVVIPLFEQKRVQIRILAAEKNKKKGQKRAVRYHDLHLWIKLPDRDMGGPPENLNLQIERLLAEYRG